MKKLQFLMVMGLGLSLVVIPLLCSSAAAQPAKTLKIGNTVPMKAKEGIQIKKWLEMFAERLNAAGGLMVKGQKYKVQIISYDDGYSADTGRAAAERLIYQDKVRHIICQWGSAPIVATLGVAEPNKVLMLCNGMTEKTMDAKWHYAYRTVSMLWSIMGLTVARAEVAKEMGCRTVVLINPDDETGHALSGKTKMAYKKLGLTVLDELFWKRGVVNYSPLATKVKSLDPDYVDTGATPSGAPTLLLAKALYEIGYTGLVFYQGLSGTWQEIVEKVSPEAIEGAIGEVKDPRIYVTDPTILKLCDAYEKKYGVLETDACYIIGGWFFLVEAVKKADSLDPDDIAAALQGLEVMTLVGKSRMIPRPDRGITRTVDSVRQNALGIVKNGKSQLHKLLSTDECIDATVKIVGWEKYYK